MKLDDIPATLRFDRTATYTFRRGPNAGRALRYVGPGVHPYADMVHVATADGQPFNNGEGKNHTTAVCRPADLVVK